MAINLTSLERATLSAAEQADVRAVTAMAIELQTALDSAEEAIQAAHVSRAPSRAIQQIVSSTLKERLGFHEEVVLTPEDGLVVRPRPDFVYTLSTGRKVIAEVERGGTTTNNHDLKDMWKAHIARDVAHLILVVPNRNWYADGSGRERPYRAVIRRIGAFFGDPRREVDVSSAHIIGYGADEPITAPELARGLGPGGPSAQVLGGQGL